MNLSSHVTELKRKHEQLSKQIEDFERAPSTDNVEVTTLKRQKLRLKEEIARVDSARS